MAMRKIYILYLADWGLFCFLRFVPKKETIYIHVIGYQGYKVQGKYSTVFTLVRHFLMHWYFIPLNFLMMWRYVRTMTAPITTGKANTDTQK